jgi:uncharacterized protein (DUF2252 family)
MHKYNHAVRPDPSDLVRRQIERDRARTKAFPQLLARKVERMQASALGFLRGSAPLFFEILRARPHLAAGPPGQGWLTGDLHVENFGAYRPGKFGSATDRVAFDLNDFDDAFRGPWRYDVVRLATSLILLARARGLGGPHSLALAGELVSAHQRKRVPAPPPCVRALIDRVRNRSRRQLLADRTEVIGERRRFVRGPRYRSLPPSLARAAARAFAAYAKDGDTCAVCDVAFRVAGTGSLGGLRIAVLTRGKGGKHGEWIFDMKEESGSASRVLEAMTACLEHPPRMAGTIRLGRKNMLVRRLAPQEDKLDLQKVDSAQLGALATYLGAKSGAAHHRGGTAGRAWTRNDVAQLVGAAAELAGLHEACYLVFCKLTMASASG